MEQDNRVARLQARMEKQQKLISVLYKKLDEQNNHTYVGQTHTLHCADGELYIEYGSIDKGKTLVMDVNQLYRDLPSIIYMVCKEQKKMQAMHLEMIKEAQAEL